MYITPLDRTAYYCSSRKSCTWGDENSSVPLDTRYSCVSSSGTVSVDLEE